MPRAGFYSDTDPKALAAFIEAQRRMTPAQKIDAVCKLTTTLIRLAEADVRRQFPHADEREVFLRATARRLGPELMRKVYGWSADA